jgi:Ras-related protein Rab-22
MRTFSVTLIGESHAGKTTLANAVLELEYVTNYKPTIGASMVKLPYQEGDDLCCFFIWDTAGMEKYRALAPVYYRDSMAALVVFDTANQDSFDKMGGWVDLYRESCPASNPLLVIGNKIDLDRVVPSVLAQKYADRIGAEYLEVSAKVGTNIDQIIPKLYRLLQAASTTDVIEAPESGTRGNCCG